MESKNSEMFTSISMSVIESGVIGLSRVVPNKRRSQGILDSIIQTNQKKMENLMESIKIYNSIMEESVNVNQGLFNSHNSAVEQLQMISFKESLEVEAQIQCLKVMLLKEEMKPKLGRNCSCEL